MAFQDKRTPLERYREELEEKTGQKISQRNIYRAVEKQADKMFEKNPLRSFEFSEKVLFGKGNLSLMNKAVIRQNLVEEGLLDGPQREIQKRTQFAGLLTVASVANSALNVLTRFDLGAGSYNAQVAGRVIDFEQKQKKWNNLRRTTLVVGSGASVVKVGVNAFMGAAVAPATAAAIGLAFVSQVASIYNDNLTLSAQRTRQNLNAEYHQMTYGAIVTRGNR